MATRSFSSSSFPSLSAHPLIFRSSLLLASLLTLSPTGPWMLASQSSRVLGRAKLSDRRFFSHPPFSSHPIHPMHALELVRPPLKYVPPAHPVSLFSILSSPPSLYKARPPSEAFWLPFDCIHLHVMVSACGTLPIDRHLSLAPIHTFMSSLALLAPSPRPLTDH